MFECDQFDGLVIVKLTSNSKWLKCPMNLILKQFIYSSSWCCQLNCSSNSNISLFTITTRVTRWTALPAIRQIVKWLNCRIVSRCQIKYLTSIYLFTFFIHRLTVITHNILNYSHKRHFKTPSFKPLLVVVLRIVVRMSWKFGGCHVKEWISRK